MLWPSCFLLRLREDGLTVLVYHWPCLPTSLPWQRSRYFIQPFDAALPCCNFSFQQSIMKNSLLSFLALLLTSRVVYQHLNVRSLLLVCSLHLFMFSLRQCFRSIALPPKLSWKFITWLWPRLFQYRLAIAEIVIQKFQGERLVLYCAVEHLCCLTALSIYGLV